MEKTVTAQKKFPEKEIAFERERLLNLIDSRIIRKEMDSAKSLAEELFKTEIGFVLLKKTRVLRKYTNLLMKTVSVLVSVLLLCTAAMILNIRPSFSLVLQAITVTGIVFAVIVDAFLMKRFKKTLRTVMEAYETKKLLFIEWVLTDGIRCHGEDWQRNSGLTW